MVDPVVLSSVGRNNIVWSQDQRLHLLLKTYAKKIIVLFFKYFWFPYDFSLILLKFYH